MFLEIGKDIKRAVFLKRINRFVGQVLVEDRILNVHIADTGRLKEILTEGRTVYISVKNDGKTKGRLLFAEVEDLILVNTSFHSKIASFIIKDILFNKRKLKIKSEFNYKDSRIDFLVDDRFLIEVKGCNLAIDNVCLFPDAPTSRGEKHLRHLIESIKDGYKPMLLILAFRECDCFFPNFWTDRKFYNTFKEAVDYGLEINIFRIKVNNRFDIEVGRKIGLCEEKWALQKISSLL